MEHVPRRRSTWKITGSIGAAVVVSLLIFWLWSHQAANRRYAELRRKVALRVSEIESRDTRRPVLKGRAEPGLAWDDYRAALELIEKVPEAEDLSRLTGPNPTGDLEWGRRLLEQYGEVLDRLHRGACRESVGRSFSWELYRQPGYRNPGLSRQWSRLYFFAEWKARQLMKAGKAREAVGVLLDVCQWGRDISSEGNLEPAGLGKLSSSLYVLREYLLSGSLDAPTLVELATALSFLDSAYPPPEHAVDASVLEWEAEMRPECEAGLGWVRLIAISAVERPWQWGELLAKAQHGPWSEVRKLQAQLDEEARKDMHPTFRGSGIGILSEGRLNREIRSHLRLLRIAAHYKATGEILDLEDPFGARFRHVLQGETLKVWSVGMNEKNDGSSTNSNIGLEVRR